MDLYKLKAKIVEANEKYRTGEAIMTDAEYDALVEQLYSIAPNDDFFEQVGYIAQDDTRKDKLPIEMKSMNKIKSIEELVKWLTSKLTPFKIDPKDVSLCLSPKYDGAAFVRDEQDKKGWTRGDGEYGQKSDAHIEVVSPNTKTLPMYSFGEIIMKDQVFEEKYSENSIGDHRKFANPRNMVAGKLNDKEVSGPLKDCHYIRYGLVAKNGKKYSKSQQLDGLNEHLNDIKVPYVVTAIDKLTTEYMLDLFNEWRKEFTLDGIIVDIDDAELCERLGRETNGNPCYARAYKANFEEVKDSPFISMRDQVSKQGLVKPVIQIEPIKLDGVTVSNVTGNNYKFIKEMKIGPGSVLKIKRSGQVIPLVMEAVVKGIPVIPTNCPCCGSVLEWTENEVDLICLNADCKDQQLGRIVAFFEILEVDNVNEGVVAQFYEAGYDTIEKILKMSQDEMKALDRFGKRKAEIVYNSIHSKMKAVPLSKIQHGSGYFKSLGSKKLKLLEKFSDQKPTVDQIIEVEGFAEKSAKAYLAGLDKFHEFVSKLPVNIIIEQPKQATSSECAGWVVVFTGTRRKDLEGVIQEKGGVIGDSVSKSTTHLIMKAKGSGSSKEVKAEKLGATIWEVSDLENFLNTTK